MERESEAKERRWIDHIDDLDFQIPQLRALANAMYCVAYLQGRNFLYSHKTPNEPAAEEELGPLSLLSQRLCDEVEQHVKALQQRLRTQDEEARAELTDILEKRTRLDPEGQTLLDEVARFLRKATPVQKAILALGVEGVRQKAQQKKDALRTAPPEEAAAPHRRVAKMKARKEHGK